MKVLNNESLKRYTTIKIGGMAKNFYMPESTNELIDLVNTLNDIEYYLISGGSNLLINDEKSFENIIHMKNVDLSITDLGAGQFYAGASVKIQKLLVTVNKLGYGGIEYLYSVPAYVGGAIAMNAGRGHKSGLAISDYITEVYVIDNGVERTLKKEECEFSYRDSIFKKKKNLIVVGAKFSFEKIDNYKDLMKNRMQLVRETQDSSGYNFGSLFREKNLFIMHTIKLVHPGYKDGITFSRKTANWLINQGNGNYKQASFLINLAIKIHKITFQKVKLEVIKWD